MRLEHEFTVPVPVEVAWRALLDVERVAPCVPGAKLTSFDGDELTGTVKVKVGPMQLLYRGSAQITTRDEEARRVVLEASGKENRGTGTAKATMTGTLAAAGEATAVRVVTDLAVTGRPAQLGGAVVAEVGQKLIDQFAAALAAELATAPRPADPLASAAPAPPATAPPAGTAPPAEPAPVNLLAVAAGPVLRRLALPAAVTTAALAVAVLLWRRRRRG